MKNKESNNIIISLKYLLLDLLGHPAFDKRIREAQQNLDTFINSIKEEPTRRLIWHLDTTRIGLSFVLQQFTYVSFGMFNSIFKSGDPIMYPDKLNYFKHRMINVLEKFVALHQIGDFKLVYDETVWHPDRLEDYGSIANLHIQPSFTAERFLFKFDFKKTMFTGVTFLSHRILYDEVLPNPSEVNVFKTEFTDK